MANGKYILLCIITFLIRSKRNYASVITGSPILTQQCVLYEYQSVYYKKIFVTISTNPPRSNQLRGFNELDIVK